MPITAIITGPNTAGTAADAGGGGNAWSNVNNAKVEDGAVASAFGGPGGGGGIINQLNLSNFGFNIPALAVIDGIKLEIKVDSDGGSSDSGLIYLNYNGGASSPGNTPNSGQNWFHAGLAWNTYGGATSLWGRTWTPAEVNHANFGASISNRRNTSTGTSSVDSVRITVYWHYALPTTPQDVPIRYVHRVYNGSKYLGILPKVTSPFACALDINSVGSTLNIEVGLSADTASQPGSRITTEAGDPITDESGNYIYTDGQPPIVGRGNSVDPLIIQNGNRIEVWQYDYYNPNGKLVFKGQVRRIGAGFGASAENKIKMLLVSTGADMDDYIARGAPFNYTNDVSQATQNNYVTVNSLGGGWNRYGQSWIVGAGASKLGAISLLMFGAATVTINVYDGPNGVFLGSITKAVDTAGVAAQIQFAVSSLINTTVGGTYFFEVAVGSGQSIIIYYNSTAPYAGGQMYYSNYGGGSGGGGFYPFTGDLYFITAYGTPTTLATYTSKDPSTEMLKPIIDDYVLRGGKINYSASSVDATGLSLTVQFNTETILDALKKLLTTAPAGFYYYVDLGTDTLYFKRTLTTPTIKLIKGRHLTKLDLEMSIENVKNDLLFSGGEVTPGVNLYKEYVDQTSKTLYGQRLARQSDNRVTVTATADAIGGSFITENKSEYYETSVSISAQTMDLTLLKPGMTVGLRGFGGFVDTLVLQITHIEYTPTQATLTIGDLPQKFSNEFESVIRGLVAQQTVSNPSAPS